MSVTQIEVQTLIKRVNSRLRKRPNIHEVKEGQIPYWRCGEHKVTAFEHTLIVPLSGVASVGHLFNLMNKAMQIRANNKPGEDLVKFEAMREGWQFIPPFAGCERMKIPPNDGAVSCVLSAIWLPTDYEPDFDLGERV